MLILVSMEVNLYHKVLVPALDQLEQEFIKAQSDEGFK